MVIPAIETGILEGHTATISQPRVELRPRPLRSFEGRKFCGSLSGSSMYSAARHGFGNMVLMLPQRRGPPVEARTHYVELGVDGTQPPT